MKLLITCIACLAIPSLVSAANPAQVATGLQLFTQEFESTAPGLNGDGLGPVFNESSCVACHNAGGVGGSGDVRSNARSLGLHEVELSGSETNDQLSAFAKFSPGFCDTNGRITSSFSLHRRGGSPEYSAMRNLSLNAFNPLWSDDNFVSTDTVHAERTPRTIANPDGSIQIKAHVFARNTTALFGTGLIDQIPDSAIWEQHHLQKRDNEISGRPSTLPDGRLGKFGWRANFASLAEFTENACANELGLQTQRVTQPADLTLATYTNPNPDIQDEAIHAMTSFTVSLPRPHRVLPDASQDRQVVDLGEQRFSAVGCAKCHTPSLGNVKDLYSDLLLHDMGPYSIDMAGAPPFRQTSTVIQQEVATATVNSYYGAVKSFSITVDPQRNTDRGMPIITRYPNRTIIVPPQYPSKLVKSSIPNTVETMTLFKGRTLGRGGQTEISILYENAYLSEVEQTLVNQEWKTPPLWGVRDSAPYMHDGRAETILEAIAMHDGEGRGSRNRFLALSYDDQQAILAFLDTFVAPTEGVIEAPKKFTRRDLAAR